jgi:hypothetical protein
LAAAFGGGDGAAAMVVAAAEAARQILLLFAQGCQIGFRLLLLFGAQRLGSRVGRAW